MYIAYQAGYNAGLEKACEIIKTTERIPIRTEDGDVERLPYPEDLIQAIKKEMK